MGLRLRKRTLVQTLELMIKHLLSSVAVVVIVSACAVHAPPPAEFPSFDQESAIPIVAVATVRPGEYLPQFPVCSKPNTICMDPPPFWFNARIMRLVHGPTIPTNLGVATTSHYGMSELELIGAEPILLYLLTDGNDFIMPRYAMAGLTKDNEGALHILVLRSPPIWWLPCSISELRREIDPQEFPADIEIPREDMEFYLDEHPNLFRQTNTGAVPRFAIRLDSISAHLDVLAPSSSRMTCELD